MIKLIVGMFTFFVALWLGAYILHDSWGVWYSFPTLVTTTVFVVAGFILVMEGCVSLGRQA